MDDHFSSDPGSSEADDDSAVLVTGLSHLSQSSSGQEDSAAESVSRPLKRKRRSIIWTRHFDSAEDIMSEREDGGSPSTSKSPKTAASEGTFPSWAQSLVQSQEGPSVAIAFNEIIDENGNNQMWCVPLRCVYPDQNSPWELDTSQAGTSNTTQVYRQFPLYFDSEDSITHGNHYSKRFSKSKDNQELRHLFVERLNSNQLPTRSPGSKCSSQSGPGKTLNTSKIPVEIFDKIGEYLSSKDVKQLRLVCKDFEKKVSGTLFRSVVVPFTSDIYGLLSPSQSKTEPISRSPLNQSNAKNQIEDPNKESNNNPMTREDQVAPHGVDVFRGFGGHIQQFGMIFDIDRESLANPPWKAMTQVQSTYWGEYIWPFPDYQRFSKTACLENAADETSTMKLAFSYLTNVKHLAISVDSGLGWMSGPDLSMRARILQEPNPVFTSTKYLPRTEILGSRKIWSAIAESYARIGAQDLLKFTELMKDQREDAAEVVRANDWREWTPIHSKMVSETQTEAESSNESPTLKKLRTVLKRLSTAQSPTARFRGFRYANGPPADPSNPTEEIRRDTTDRMILEAVDEYSNHLLESHTSNDESAVHEATTSNAKAVRAPPSAGILYTKQMKVDRDAQRPRADEIEPRYLKRAQREWLLETAWAQDAFTSSYLLAVADNHATFSNVTELTISPISSRYLPKLHRSEFWNALRSISKVEVIVSADWRDVVKEHNDLLTTPALLPSDSVNTFTILLRDTISRISSIKCLVVGWKDGGEHAEGLCARNKKILPAPLLPKANMLDSASIFADVVGFPHVDSITLRNCWMSPDALVGFVAVHQKNLKQVTLDSVSLTAHPSIPVRRRGFGGGALVGGAAVGVVAGVLFAAVQQTGVVGQLQPNLAPNLAGSAPMPGVGLAWQQITALPFNQPALNAFQGGLPVASAIQRAITHHNSLVFAHGGPYGPGQGHEPGLGYVPAAQRDQIEAQLQVHFHQLYIYQAQMNSMQQTQAMQAPVVRRRGCWPEVLENIRHVYLGENKPNLRISLLSCGHVKLPITSFDQTALEQAYELSNESCHRSAFFNKRRAELKDYMLTTGDTYLARIVSAIPENEMIELQTQWGMESGWPSPELAGPDYNDDDGWGKWGHRTAFAPAMDGQPYGGTGRFSGKINGFEMIKKEEKEKKEEEEEEEEDEDDEEEEEEDEDDEEEDEEEDEDEDEEEEEEGDISIF